MSTEKEFDYGSIPKEIVPSAPDQPQSQVMNADLPPAYDAVPPQYSKLFWRNYNKNQSAYCCTDCCCRIILCPCMITGAVISCPCYLLSCCCTCTDNCNDKEKNCCCIYNSIDSSIPHFAYGSVGLVKFPESRSKLENDNVEFIKSCCDCVFCCPCNMCIALCNSQCLLWIKDIICNCSERTKQCVTGAMACCGLICQRCCGKPPSQQEMS